MVADVPAVNVKVEVPLPLARDAGLNAAVTPAGTPEADSETADAKPPDVVEVIDVVPLPPCTVLMAPGEALRAKFAGGGALATVSETDVVRLRPPPVPVIVTVYVPVAVDAPAANVSVEDPDPLLNVAGLKVAVTPDGTPEADSATDDANPPELVAVIVVVFMLPWVTLTEAGEAERVKFAAVMTV